VAVRRIEAYEGAQLRDIRLRALRDAPWAFGATLEAEMALTGDEWAARAELNAAAETSVVFVAADWSAMAGGHVPWPDRPVVRLWGMWIAPGARGHGLAEELVAAVDGWARSLGARELELAVSERADAAFALYRRLGFELMPEREPLQVGGTLRTRRMRRELG
jgi:ribosomal protein S18 acetylase RimI-like enzyme